MECEICVRAPTDNAVPHAPFLQHHHQHLVNTIIVIIIIIAIIVVIVIITIVVTIVITIIIITTDHHHCDNFCTKVEKVLSSHQHSITMKQ